MTHRFHLKPQIQPSTLTVRVLAAGAYCELASMLHSLWRVITRNPLVEHPVL